MTSNILPEWFNNNKDAMDIYVKCARLLDIADNMIDGDKVVSGAEILEAFTICLYHLPLNPVYRNLELQIAPMWLSIISAYDTANQFERAKDEHGIELSHTLRYAVGHLFAYLIACCVGIEKSKEYVPAMWKCMAAERFEVYRNEHLGNNKSMRVLKCFICGRTTASDSLGKYYCTHCAER